MVTATVLTTPEALLLMMMWLLTLWFVVQVAGESRDSVDFERSPEMDRAAVIIQANYKGYKTRKSLGRI